MAIRYPVALGTLVICDYSQGGFKPPEMVKRRPVIVVSPRRRNGQSLCTIVPLSTTAPLQDADYVVQLTLAERLTEPFDSEVCWAKCDMLATVAFARLDLFRTRLGENGKRQFFEPRLTGGQLRTVQAGILAALGLSHT